MLEVMGFNGYFNFSYW